MSVGWGCSGGEYVGGGEAFLCVNKSFAAKTASMEATVIFSPQQNETGIDLNQMASWPVFIQNERLKTIYI